MPSFLAKVEAAYVREKVFAINGLMDGKWRSRGRKEVETMEVAGSAASLLLRYEILDLVRESTC
jgi:hypothetical protein